MYEGARNIGECFTRGRIPDPAAAIENIFVAKMYHQWAETLKRYKLVWSVVTTPLEVISDEQAIANEG